MTVTADQLLKRLGALQKRREAPRPDLSAPADRPALETLLARTKTGTPPPPETQRVVRLPRASYDAPDLTHMFKAPHGTMSLRPIQSAALWAIRDAQGLVAPIGVGHGKTLIGLLAGTALSLPQGEWPMPVPPAQPVDRVLYMTSAGCVNQTRRAVIEMAQHWALPPQVVVRSYSGLSQPTASAAFAEWVGYPASRTLVVLDEAHKLKRPEAARTKRFLRAWKNLKGVRYLVTSGTLISRSLKDGATLAAVALRDRSPLPRSTSHLQAWCDWIDDTGIPNAASWGTLAPLLANFAPPGADRLPAQQRARKAFAARLRSSPGVVASAKGALDLSLQIATLKSPGLPPEVEKAIAAVKDTGARPDGEVFEDDMSERRVMRQLACGFWYRWDWGEEGPDHDWMDARKEWHRQLRAELSHNSREHYDSPLLVTNELDRRMKAGDGCGELGRSLVEWRKERERRKDPPPTVPVWVSNFLVADGAKWLKAKRGRLLWYESRAICERLEALGCRVIRAGEDPPLDTDESLALSIRGHGTGLCLHNWSNNRILECPTSAETWEQLLGRTHRPGQKAEEVTAGVYTHCEVMKAAWKAARRNAQMLEHTTGNMQKLVYADID